MQGFDSSFRLHESKTTHYVLRLTLLPFLRAVGPTTNRNLPVLLVAQIDVHHCDCTTSAQDSRSSDQGGIDCSSQVVHVQVNRRHAMPHDGGNRECPGNVDECRDDPPMHLPRLCLTLVLRSIRQPQLVVPGEKRPGRWFRHIIAIDVFDPGRR